MTTSGEDPLPSQKRGSPPSRRKIDPDSTRCFTYAEKWDFLMMAAAAIAAIGAGVVSIVPESSSGAQGGM